MDIKIPQLSENLKSGTVVRLFVKEGERIKKGQQILELETEKAVAAIPSPVAGVVEKIYVKEGDEATVGQSILSLSPESASEKVPAAKPAEPPQPTKKPESREFQPKLSGRPQKDETERLPSDLPVAASPSVRKIAFQLGIDLGKVPGSARGGRITMEDLKDYIQTLEQSAGGQIESRKPSVSPAITLPDFSSWGPVHKEPASVLRKTIAQKMSEIWNTVPHVTQFDEADITELMKKIRKYEPVYKQQETHLTLTAVLLKALVPTLKKHPPFNASWDPSREEIIYKDYYHFGIAVDTEQGLMVPVIRNVNRKSLLEISKEISDLAQKARTRKITSDEMRGGTFTVSNQGGIGGGHFTPIINAPEVAILGVGRGASKAAGRVLLPLSLSYDHRILDGANAVRFIRDLAVALETFDEKNFILNTQALGSLSRKKSKPSGRKK